MTPLKKGDLIKPCKYTFIRERPATGIEAFKAHKRLKVFFHKGFGCVTPNCSHVGTRLIFSTAINGKHNWDLFTDDLVMMTVDHVIAKKNGGSNDIENLQPMCCHCNTAKGHQEITLDELALQMVDFYERKAAKRQKDRDRRDPKVISRKREERRIKRETAALEV